MVKIHEREEWLQGYVLSPGEGEAWWGGNTFPSFHAINNLTWHYPGGDVSDQHTPVLELQNEQHAYHRRLDGGNNGRPAPYTHGYDLGYNAMIDVNGEIWKVRWTDKQCAANGGSDHGNLVSFAIQFMTEHLNDGANSAQTQAAQWLDGYLRNLFPSIPVGVNGHKGHRDWFPTACPGDVIYQQIKSGTFLMQTPPPPDTGDDDLTSTYVTDGSRVIVGEVPGSWRPISGVEFYGLRAKHLQDPDVHTVLASDLDQMLTPRPDSVS